MSNEAKDQGWIIGGPEFGEWQTVGEICGRPIRVREPLNQSALEGDVNSALIYDLYMRLQKLEERAKTERAYIVAQLREEAEHKESIGVVNTAETLRRLADNFEAGYGRTKPEDEK